LQSVREVIVLQSSNAEALLPYLNDIKNILFENMKDEEEGTRSVVGECIGQLALHNEQIIKSLTPLKDDPSPFVRSCCLLALKFSISEKSSPIDSILKEQINSFLNLLTDKDINVRRNTLLLLNFAAHNKPSLIRDVIGNHLPKVYVESKIRPELIRIIDLGPFKHKVDDGLELRLAAFQCMYTLIDHCLDRVDVPVFVANLVDGLKDESDIAMITHLMLIKLAKESGPAVIEGLSNLVEPLRVTITTKPKEGSVKQEIEKNDEIIRSALRAVAAISRIPGSEQNHKFEEFIRTTVKTGEIAEKYNAVLQETAESD